MINGSMPTELGGTTTSHCLTLYNWCRQVDQSWLDAGQRVFAALGTEPVSVSSSLGNRNVHGSFARLEGKVRSFLGSALSHGEFDVRMRGPVTNPDREAFPSDFEFAFSGTKSNRESLCLAVQHGVVEDCSELLNIVGEIIISYTGPCYGAVFDFPAEYGPSFYLSSIAFNPRAVSWDANQNYADRITRWKDRIGGASLNPSAGYFREIYEINLLTDAHLRASFQERPFGEFAERVGTVRALPYCEGMYRWDVPRVRLEATQNLLEGSGLVLSS